MPSGGPLGRLSVSKPFALAPGARATIKSRGALIGIAVYQFSETTVGGHQVGIEDKEVGAYVPERVASIENGGRGGRTPSEGKLSLAQFLPYRLSRSAERITMGFAKIYKAEYGITRPEWRCMALLGLHGEMTAADIAEGSDMHRTQVSRALAALENRFWIRRTPDPTDRRSERAELTPKGVSIYDELVHAARAYERRICEQLGDDVVRGLDKGLTALEGLKDLQ